ncbi:MAG: glycosyltransferase family 39 protein, partial [Armatimonadetes bacterium]|nr:glycosyltransferase family 39 protein [Armatimonadota bacterium]
MTESADRAARRGFWRLAAAHLAAWTLLPALCYPNAPLDAVEMYYWGHQWQWGYSKHPPLPGWLAAVVVDGGLGAPGLYLLSQLCVLACFWSAWRLGVELLGPRLALWSVVLLQGVFYFSVTSPEFNNNLGLMAFLA